MQIIYLLINFSLLIKMYWSCQFHWLCSVVKHGICYRNFCASHSCVLPEQYTIKLLLYLLS